MSEGRECKHRRMVRQGDGVYACVGCGAVFEGQGVEMVTAPGVGALVTVENEKKEENARNDGGK